MWKRGLGSWSPLGEAESFCSRDGARWLCSGPAEALGDVCVGQLNLRVSCTRVGELIPGIGVLEVPPQACHLRWDIVVAIFLGHNLQQRWQDRDGVKA